MVRPARLDRGAAPVQTALGRLISPPRMDHALRQFDGGGTRRLLDSNPPFRGGRSLRGCGILDFTAARAHAPRLLPQLREAVFRGLSCVSLTGLMPHCSTEG